MSLTLDEAKEFIIFCLSKNVVQAKYKELEFAAQIYTEEKNAQATSRVPTDDELLYGVTPDEFARGNTL